MSRDRKPGPNRQLRNRQRPGSDDMVYPVVCTPETVGEGARMAHAALAAGVPRHLRVGKPRTRTWAGYEAVTAVLAGLASAGGPAAEAYGPLQDAALQLGPRAVLVLASVQRART